MEKQLNQGHSSDLVSLVVPNPKYQKLLAIKAKKLSKKYKNQYLNQVFSTLDKKLLTIGPVSLCDNLVKDLGGECNDQLLTAIGLCCLVISSHDDVVDEPPKNRSEIAALVYAGNIALLEGIKLFIKLKKDKTLVYLIDTINQNHYYQQLRVDLVWEQSPKDLKQYLKGIADGQSLAMIGPICALSLTNNDSLIQRLSEFSKSYAIILQLIDDIKETDEDKLSGYNSYALLEGKPFTNSFKEVRKHLRRAERLLNPEWKNTRAQFTRLRDLSLKLISIYETTV